MNAKGDSIFVFVFVFVFVSSYNLNMLVYESYLALWIRCCNHCALNLQMHHHLLLIMMMMTMVLMLMMMIRMIYIYNRSCVYLCL